MKRTILLAAALVFATTSSVHALENHAGHDHAGHDHSGNDDAGNDDAGNDDAGNDDAGNDDSMPGQAAIASPMAGPYGGSLKRVGEVQLETVVSQGGIQMFVYARNGQQLAVNQGRGAASLRVEGNAKRYRYDLLPDGKGGLTAAVNLSQIAGRQIEIEIQLVGIAATRGQTISFREVATVPATEMQLAAAAIARQKICPVSGKPLGSMGDPVAVDVNGQRLFVCSGGCVSTVESNPAKYAAGRPEITVTSATEADAELIARQKLCPVMDEPLGGMGNPIKVTIGDKPIFLCCKGCIKKVKADPAKYLAMVYGEAAEAGGTEASVPAGTEEVRSGVFKVSAEDAPFIAAQKVCPVMDEPLDTMGGPYKVYAAGKAVYICCPGCAKKIAAQPQKYLAILANQGVNSPLMR